MIIDNLQIPLPLWICVSKLNLHGKSWFFDNFHADSFFGSFLVGKSFKVEGKLSISCKVPKILSKYSFIFGKLLRGLILNLEEVIDDYPQITISSEYVLFGYFVELAAKQIGIYL